MVGRTTLAPLVSIHAPGRGATRPRRRKDLRDSRFQFTHPGGVRLGRHRWLLCHRAFQFTHPGGVRLRLTALLVGNDDVSIHAPGRGATRPVHLSLWRIYVSIHAPGRGATRGENLRYGVIGVSIHAPGRGATCFAPVPKLGNNVSIHAPGRGATRAGYSPAEYMSSFNSRTREGCDATSCLSLSWVIMFQFTHPGGVRPCTSDPCQLIFFVSIHAPGRGATVWCKVAYYGADKQA